MKLVLATRRSPLALWQANEARTRLITAFPELEVELLEVVSSGDRNQTEDLARFGSIGIFTVEVDRAVLEGQAHAAVHSLKDLTTTLLEGTRLAGVLPRGPIEDAWLQPEGQLLAELSAGARVATGSLRRTAMLRALRPELEVVPVRGNVETRLRKLAGGTFDAMILARAGLERLELGEHITEVLGIDRFLPAVGQGLVGLTCRADDQETRTRLHAISDLEDLDAGLAERGLLAGLRGGCNVPIGAHARTIENSLHLRARVLTPDGTESLEAEITGSRDHATQLGTMLAEELIGKGADELLEKSRQQSAGS